MRNQLAKKQKLTIRFQEQTNWSKKIKETSDWNDGHDEMGTISCNKMR